MLNAFRHHGLYRSRSRAARAPSRYPCAQRLSASRIISALRVEQDVRAEISVLNAFRHHGLYRPRRPGRCRRSQPSAQRLSASRIISAYVDDAVTLAIGAQRLSASRIISENPNPSRVVQLSECSTPFGITDYIGRPSCYCRRRRRAVLNAFRHHGLYRPRPRPSTSTPAAPVLNAFRHHGLYRPAAGYPVPTE